MPTPFKNVLRGIISLKLIKGIDGKMTAAVEVLKNSPRIAKLIEDGLTKDLQKHQAFPSKRL